jgi:Fe(3+) dicitrate transport protein
MSRARMIRLVAPVALAAAAASPARAEPPPESVRQPRLAPASVPAPDDAPVGPATPVAPADPDVTVEAAAAPIPAPIREAAAPSPAAVAGETIEIQAPTVPGAEATVGRELLERTERDDIHAVLGHVAGVYLREEDGYGLRPNIGMRGAAAERSAKVALLEDGVLIVPAPYSAPAAYYFPLVTRMSRIEVVKGPSSVVYGPNTVGGAVNLVGEPMPGERAGYVDAAVGSDRYAKLHGRFAERGERWGLMGEYVKLRTDGFKAIDGGGPSGFDKNDAQLWGRVHTSTRGHVYHQLDARVGFGDEESHETYTGLTGADFASDPQRRYAGTQRDRMIWDHWRFRLAHRLEIGSGFSLETTAYRHALDRVWGKVDGFVGNRDMAGLLADPMGGSNGVYYAVLTGQADSASPEEELIRGVNDRSFVSQGIQTRALVTTQVGPTGHRIDVGVRLHGDRADRRRREDAYAMMGGQLFRSERPSTQVLDSRASTLAVAMHAQDQVRWGRLAVTGGARLELLATAYDDHLTGAEQAADYAVLIPGGGVEYDLTPAASIVAGVHRGFVPVAPSGDAEVRPESSINYEAGGRWRAGRLSADVIGFFSDYSNLKGTCTQSSGCDAAQDGDEFNGGRVHVWGTEVQAASEIELPRALRLPLQASYTYTGSSFQHSFESEFAGWNQVMEGDELPYLPEHQASLASAVVASRWEVGAAARWHGATRDVAGQGAIDPGSRIDSLVTIDLSAHARLAGWAELYATCDNLLDEQRIVSRRPYGIRPNAPRLFMLGYKARF